MNATYRADNLGSLLRPAYLLEAHARGVSGAELRAIEDRAILEALRLQEEVGLPVVTDGEYRRNLFFSTVTEVADGFDPEGYERFHRDEQGNVLRFGAPTPVARLRRRARLSEVEFEFTRAHTSCPVKVTMPAPSLLLNYWKAGVSDRAYESQARFMDDLTALMNEDARDLAAHGAAYLQLDAPHYTYVTEIAAAGGAAGIDPLARLQEMIALDNRVFDGVSGVTTGMHLCRGNYRSRFTGTRPYDEYAETVFPALKVHRLLLEYDDARSGDFGPLRHVPEGVTAVLGLVTTKRSELEREETLLRRVEEATRYLPLQRLAISTQCGFASTMEGNAITPEAQRAKLELVVRAAQRVWGYA